MIKILKQIIIAGALLFALFLLKPILPIAQIESYSTLFIFLGALFLFCFIISETLPRDRVPKPLLYLLAGAAFSRFFDVVYEKNIKDAFNGAFSDELRFFIILSASFLIFFSSLKLRRHVSKNDIKYSLFSGGLAFILFLTSFIVFIGVSNPIEIPRKLIYLSSIIGAVLLGFSTSFEFSPFKFFSSTDNDIHEQEKNQAHYIREFISINVLVLIILFAPIFINSDNNPIISSYSILIPYLIGCILGVSALILIKHLRKRSFILLLIVILFIETINFQLGFLPLLSIFLAGIIITSKLKDIDIFDKTFAAAIDISSLSLFALLGFYFKLNLSGELYAVGAIFAVLRILFTLFSNFFLKHFYNKTEQASSNNLFLTNAPGFPSLIIVLLIFTTFPGMSDSINAVFLTYYITSMILGAVLSNFKKNNNTEEPIKIEESKNNYLSDKKNINQSKGIFAEPSFEDANLNKLTFNILISLNNIYRDFEKRIINQRSEQSIELIISATEKYSEHYSKIKSVLSQSASRARDIQNIIVETQKNISIWFNSLLEDRKLVEKKVIDIEPILLKLFESIINILEGLPKIISVDYEQDKYKSSKEDSFYTKLHKFYLKFKIKTNRFFNKDYKLKRLIKIKQLAAYFFVGKSSSELLETINMIGFERLLTLKKIKLLYEDINRYLQELYALAEAEKDNPALTSILLDKFEESHKQFINEISIFQEEVVNTGEEISHRLKYALSNPYNDFITSLSTAGTYLDKSKKFKFSNIYSESEISREKAQESLRNWINYYLGFLGLAQKDAVIFITKAQIIDIADKHLLSVLINIDMELRNASKKLWKSLKKHAGDFASDKTISQAELRKLLANLMEELSTQIIDESLANLQKIGGGKKFNFIVKNLIAEFTKLSRSMPENIYFLEESNLIFKNRVSQYIPLKSINFREIASPIITTKLPREYGEISEIIQNHLSFTAEELKNIGSMIKYHIDSAFHEIEDDNDSSMDIARELIKSLFDKIEERINKLNRQIDRIETNIAGKLAAKADSATLEIETVVKRKYSDVIFSNLDKEFSKFPFYNTIIKICGFLATSLKKGIALTLSAIDSMPATLIKLRAYFKSTGKHEFSTDAELDETKLKNLPFIYRKLFDGSPLETTADLFVERDNVITTVGTALSNFYAGKSSASLIVGEPGSGKKSLINSISIQLLGDFELFNVSFDKTVYISAELFSNISKTLGFSKNLNFEELKTALNDKSHKRAIVIEDIHKLYLKKPGGYEALNSLTALISQTGKSVFWLCTINKHPWTFLQTNFQLNNIFAYIIYTEILNQKDIRSIIMSRHNATGFELKFISKYSKIKKLAAVSASSIKNQDVAAADEFFKDLNNLSEGNIITAMFYWLKSIQSVKGNLITMNPCKEINLTALKTLDIISALTLVNIIHHGYLTDEEHSLIFNMNIEKSREILIKLANMNLIYEDQFLSGTNKYFLNKYLYKFIEKELIYRNIL